MSEERVVEGISITPEEITKFVKNALVAVSALMSFVPNSDRFKKPLETLKKMFNEPWMIGFLTSIMELFEKNEVVTEEQMKMVTMQHFGQVS